jgi:hypothetical protein
MPQASVGHLGFKAFPHDRELQRRIQQKLPEPAIFGSERLEALMPRSALADSRVERVARQVRVLGVLYGSHRSGAWRR